jgi:hypothetical protein
MGPWNAWLREPGIGKAIWDLTLAMTANATMGPGGGHSVRRRPIPSRLAQEAIKGIADVIQ